MVMTKRRVIYGILLCATGVVLIVVYTFWGQHLSVSDVSESDTQLEVSDAEIEKYLIQSDETDALSAAHLCSIHVSNMVEEFNAIVYAKMHEADDAEMTIEEMRQAVRRMPKSEGLDLRQKLYDKAENNETKSVARLRLSEFYQEHHDYAKAREYLYAIIDDQSTSSAENSTMLKYLELAFIDSLIMDYEKQAEYAMKAIAIPLRFSEGPLVIAGPREAGAKAYVMLGEYDKARALLNEIIDWPELKDPILQAGMLYRKEAAANALENFDNYIQSLKNAHFHLQLELMKHYALFQAVGDDYIHHVAELYGEDYTERDVIVCGNRIRFALEYCTDDVRKAFVEEYRARGLDTP